MYETKVVGIKEDLFDFISTLRILNAFHVKETVKTKEAFEREKRIILENFETRIAAIFSHLPIESKLEHIQAIKTRSNEKIINEAENLLRALEPKVQQLQSEKNRLETKIKQLERYEPILERIEPLSQKIEDDEALASIIVMLDRRSEITLVEFEAEIRKRTQGLYEIFHKSIGEHFDAVLLLIDGRFIKEIYTYLTGERISEIAFPRELRDIKLKDMKNKITALISEQQESIEKLKQEEKELIETKDLIRLHTLQGEILARLNEFQLADKMGGTADTFELEGFVPKSRWNEFQSELLSKFGKRIVITKSKAKKEAPVLRKNPRIVRPFELITNMIQLPEYGSIDPTPLIFLLFPFFWGFMVGDVGYAGIILVIALFLRMRFKRNQQKALQNISEIFIISSIWAMFFGVLYLEFFGDLGEHIIHDLHLDIHPVLNRYDDVQELLILSVIVGYLIVMGGMVLSIYNNLKLNHKSHVFSNLFLILIWGSIPVLIIVGITTPDLFSSVFMGDILLILVSIFFLFRLEGIAGVIHVIEKFSNILSFARLMAIGLVGAWMGLIANSLISHPFSIFGITLFGILLGLSLHIINILILILSPSIHAMRLNVYEFFSQFVVGGGNLYKPFGSI